MSNQVNRKVLFDFDNIFITHQCHIPHLTCPVGAAFSEAGFGKEVVVDIFVWEQLAALYEGFQNAEIDFFIRPFALAEKGGVFVLFGKNIDFSPVSYTHLDVYKRQLYGCHQHEHLI